ncbi:MAG: group II intron reverse transcriptase/maturase [Moorea sp. SIO3G5]|nr:group II intron reverse transcriptase/maturase [Moorena sp. SIO3G5]
MNKSKTKGYNPKSEWKEVNWRKLELTVYKLQNRIYRASQRGNVQVVRRLQKTLMKSWSAKMLAVRKVTQENKGKKTAGIDGQKALSSKKRLKLAENLKIYRKPQPTPRVWIDKPGRNEKRPLGIPTIYDRALQALTKLALEPEWEAKFEPNSYGFRPGRSCHDAIAAIFTSIKGAQKWVLDADISKCFDKINHQTLLEKLNTYPSMRRLIKGWLKAGVMEGKKFLETKEGTPQGGIISPLLANIALHGMENYLMKVTEEIKSPGSPTGRRGRRKATSIIRYADDFVIIHPSKEATEILREHVEKWLKDIGLELKPSKTKMVHTLEGFDFLGYNVRQYKVGKHHSKQGFKTLIKPSKKKVKEHVLRLSDTVDRMKAARQEDVIHKLRPIITGWGNYYKPVVSKRTYSKVDSILYSKLKRWGERRHPKKSKKWVKEKYWGTKERPPKKPGDAPRRDNWVFMTKEDNYLPKHAWIEIKRHIKVKDTRSPFDGDLTYWGNRMQKHPELNTIKGKLFKRQEGRCAKCGLNFREGDIMEAHHITPLALGGKDTLKNQELLHLHCHDQKHGKRITKSQRDKLDSNPF